MAAQRPQRVISHPTAVLIIASVATVWGFGFPMTRIVLDGGLSVGGLMSIRFPLAGLLMFAVIRPPTGGCYSVARRAKISEARQSRISFL